MKRSNALLVMLILTLATVAIAASPASPGEAAGSEGDAAIAFLEARVAADPDDTVAWNRLGQLYLGKLRSTGDHDYLDAAARCAEASLRAVPDAQNPSGLILQIRSKLGGHYFAEAERLSRRLIELDAAGALGWQLLGDALLELGRYDEARKAFDRSIALGGTTAASETRLARLAFLHGDRASARQRLDSAKSLASAARERDTVAWCEWQLGELAFGGGDLKRAGRHFDAALAIDSRSIPALGSRARLAAARGELSRAIAMYEEVIALDAFAPFVAALADLHAVTGDAARAAELFAQIEENAASPRERRLDRRHLARIYSDHDLKPREAHEMAAADFAERQDIHAADTLAWAALKAGKLDEAESAMKEALRLGTEDATLFYHAGMIALRRGDEASARKWLGRALRLNPKFDLLQARVAQEALKTLR